jgi:hypothetical protein
VASNCAGTSTGNVPLTDLGPATYQGFLGGLYPGGSNARPAAHQAAGLAAAGAIVPLDTLGNPAADGKVVLISIGMSNCTQEFSALIPKANADPGKRPDVRLIDCARGGQAAGDINTPGAAYWDTVFTRLRGHGSSPLQPQVVWLKQAERAPTGGFPAATNVLLADLGAIVRIVKQKLPNVRACYFTSRIYAGYASTTLNPEPYAYESGFAVKWLIEAQINGVDSLNHDPAAGPVEAPWLSWGPYLWADGLVARADGFTWQCSSFVTSDGTHPSVEGRNIVADSLLAFFKRDDTTAPWFLNGTTGVPAPVFEPRFAVAPNPARTHVELMAASPLGSIEVVDAAGRRVFSTGPLGRALGLQSEFRFRWNLRGSDGRRVPPGLYWMRAAGGGGARSARVLVLEPR